MKLCIFVDGLDEYSGLGSELANLFKNAAQAPYVKVCVSSRPLLVFKESFQSHSSGRSPSSSPNPSSGLEATSQRTPLHKVPASREIQVAPATRCRRFLRTHGKLLSYKVEQCPGGRFFNGWVTKMGMVRRYWGSFGSENMPPSRSQTNDFTEIKTSRKDPRNFLPIFLLPVHQNAPERASPA